MDYVLKYSAWQKVFEVSNGNIPDSLLDNVKNPDGTTGFAKLNKAAAADFNRMVAAAKAEGKEIKISQGYRPLGSKEEGCAAGNFTQWCAWQKYKAGIGNKAAPPGSSHHGLGGAVDVKNCEAGGVIHTWLKQNAQKFGFQPLASEPWHWDHTATVNAKSIPTTSSSSATNALAVKSGKISHGYTGEKAKNIDLLIKTMQENGITNPYSQAGILSTIAKETDFIPQNEIMNYSKERLPEVWGVFSKTGKKVEKGQGKYNYNDLAIMYEHQPEKLANFVYGQKPYGVKDNAYGNTEPGDGWKYRGRGFNGITFKKGYEKYKDITGIDLVSYPDLLNDPPLAAKVAVLYFKKSLEQKKIDPNGFTNLEDAVRTFANANAGWGSTFGIDSALTASKKFSVTTV